MRKLFGQFLVERGTISEEELLQVLIEQSSKVPPLYEILYQNHILGSSELIKAFAYQYENDVEFKTALKSLNFWTRRVSEDVDRFVRNNREPIGQILVRSGRVSFEEMNNALEGFLVESYREGNRSRSSNQIPPEVDLSPSEAMDVELVKECGKVVSKVLESDLPERLKKLAESGIYDEELCDSVAIDIHRIKSAMYFVGANINANFAGVMEQAFNYLTCEDGFGDWVELVDLVVRGLSTITDYTRDLLATQSETSGFDKFAEIEAVSNELRQLVLTQLEIGRHQKPHQHESHDFNILLIDGAKSVHRYFVHCLAGHSAYGPLSALDWAEAQKKIAESKPSVVIVDSNLPIADKSLAVLRNAHPSVPLVQLSSRKTDKLADPFDAILHKPFNESDLINTLGAVLKKAGKTAA